MTLPEVMIALLIASMVAISALAALHAFSKRALSTAIRNEAHRLIQVEGERLMSVPYSEYAPVPDQIITSSVKTTFLAGTETRFTYFSDDPTARVAFTRRIVDNMTPIASKPVLRVEVAWSFRGRSHLISTPFFRSE